jgi:5-methylcytosine-specific restriction endonuclease McrA
VSDDDDKQDDDDRPEASMAVATKLLPAVVRTKNLPAVSGYKEYLPALRKDFLYSCAYCTITEAETKAKGMSIDHYEPVTARPDLENEYTNLMYVCEVCNSYKGDRTPPESARNAGLRFFKADEDVRSEHFKPNGVEVEGKTPVGEFTVDAVDLNRDGLQKIRALRRKLIDSEEFAAEGIAALASFPIDRIGPLVRGEALAAINEALKLTEDAFDDFDELLMEFAKSPLLADEETEEERQRKKERLKRLRAQEGLHPGVWRGRHFRRKGN